MKMDIKARLGTIAYKVDDVPHIIINTEICIKCPHKFCTLACPAKCFQWVSGKLIFNYEDCVECGTCDIACDQGAVKWGLPRGPYGVRYSHG